MTDFNDPKKMEKEIFKKLSKVTDSLSGKYVTKVGVLGDKDTRTSDENIDNAGLGLVHEFGSIEKGIPARSWLRLPILSQVEKIIKSVSKNKKRIEKEVSDGDDKVIYEILGGACESAIQEAFETHGFGTWKPKKINIDNLEKQSPLIMTGAFRQSISSEVSKK